ncbi:SAM-dependent methyltransferase [Phytoactinopolyspora alkaliphila]|uniref:SAM-dependent methyltransferase n=1 Tax=Phytoactinopolyspora alkaliphila TaxID=1783498 RepID=A0A6N9YK58_9ACTN|nr:SAM-dependent methyltransferase [Phytoactinopolyspora alkaliphila]NED95354.1 SAM-dependent methyltransferase [Phytoactinopolyspora alkaliphila]
MAGCCEPQGYDLIFSSGQAERDAARYRKSGLTWAPRRTVELFNDGTFGGESVLEIGGGIGDLQVELLRAGMARAMSVELSVSYEAAAGRLLRQAGLAGRSVRLTGDFAQRPELAQPADVVVLHSVVCCYADAGRLLSAAADRARKHLVLSYPRETWWLRAWAPIQNIYPRLRRSDWRFYIHSEAAILAAIEHAGLRRIHIEHTRIDHLAVFSRTE